MTCKECVFQLPIPWHSVFSGIIHSVFVTTSTFSQPARDYVRHLAQRVILIDGQELAGLMIEHGVGVRGYRTVEFKRLDEDFFGEE